VIHPSLGPAKYQACYLSAGGAMGEVCRTLTNGLGDLAGLGRSCLVLCSVEIRIYVFVCGLGLCSEVDVLGFYMNLNFQ